jgi:hypothetical protein
MEQMADNGTYKILFAKLTIFRIPNPDKPEPNRFEDKKIDHESTKIRRHESLNVVLFRIFVIVFQNFLPEKTRFRTKVLRWSTSHETERPLGRISSPANLQGTMGRDR